MNREDFINKLKQKLLEIEDELNDLNKQGIRLQQKANELTVAKQFYSQRLTEELRKDIIDKDEIIKEYEKSKQE